MARSVVNGTDEGDVGVMYMGSFKVRGGAEVAVESGSAGGTVAGVLRSVACEVALCVGGVETGVGGNESSKTKDGAGPAAKTDEAGAWLEELPEAAGSPKRRL